MRVKLHFVTAARDQITNEITTRCGLKGSLYRGTAPRPARASDALEGDPLVWLALGYADVTCPGCKMRISANGKIVLRLIYQHGQPELIFQRGFDWSMRTKLKLWLSATTWDQLIKLKLVSASGNLTLAGRSVAMGLPKIQDGFR